MKCWKVKTLYECTDVVLADVLNTLEKQGAKNIQVLLVEYEHIYKIIYSLENDINE